MRGDFILAACLGLGAIGVLLLRKSAHDRTDEIADRLDPPPPFPPAGFSPAGEDSGAPACDQVGRESPGFFKPRDFGIPVFPRDPVRRARWQSLFD